jgi:hypothetical protein
VRVALGGPHRTEGRYFEAEIQPKSRSALSNPCPAREGPSFEGAAPAANVLDSDTTLQKAQLSAYRYNNSSTNFQAQGGLNQLQGSNDILGGIFGGASSPFKEAPNLGFLGGSFGNGFGGTAHRVAGERESEAALFWRQ